MAEIVVMPALGNSVESSLISEWLVQVGDTVNENTLLCAIETDKSSMEVPAGVAGVVLALLAEEGDDVPVKQPIAVVGEEGETVDPALLGNAGAASEPDSTEAAPTQSDPAASEAPTLAAPTSPQSGARVSDSDSPVSPRARNLAHAQGVAANKLQGTGPHGRVIARDVEAAIAAGPGLTRGARAEADGFVPGRTGSGIGGRVTRADLASIPTEETSAPATASQSTGPATGQDFPGAFTQAPLKGVRKVIADRMMSSLQNSAQLTLDTTAPADGLLALRKKLKNAPENLGLNQVTIGDLIGYAVVKTLVRYPALNAHLDGGTLTTFDSVHLGIAVDTPRGLLVPTVRFSEAMTLRQFSSESKRVAYGAIDGDLDPALLAGGTFTVTNLGSFGIEAFTPVLNAPQVSILGVGAITPRPKLNADGSVGIENRVWLSLTMDHQAYDGADGARFLKDLSEAIANIELTVLG
ncbi:dihydrolipoamide acetyltransferase family protein [Actinomyces sp. F1_1611]